MKVPVLKPRNPFAMLASKRKGGSHKKPLKSLRGKANRDIMEV